MRRIFRGRCNITCCSGQCKWRSICDGHQSWEPIFLARPVFGDVAVSLFLPSAIFGDVGG